ncbi:MAG: penicillin-binding protein, partial [Synergistes sp.]|nr:penicillin-binding protein [Synergistes sp.]
MILSKKEVNDRDFSIDRKVKKKKSFFAALLSSFALFFIIAGAIAAVLLTLFLKNITETLPTYQDILEHEPSLATVVYDRNGKVVTQLFKENRTWVKLDDISPWMIKAALAAEDDSFYEHSGIRPIAIVRALIVDAFHRGAKQGASTITQQLARNLFLSNEKTVIRKAKEAVLALRLEKVYTKDQLLEMYLNTIYMGHGAYGVESAAKTYFNKKPKNLTADEAALLAGLVAAPEKYSPLRNKSAAQARKAYVLRRMLDLDWMSKDDYDANINKETKLAEHKSRKNSFAIDNAPYFVSHILFNELLPMYGTEKVYRGGLKVNTTIDLDLQKKAEEVVSKMPHEGALVALDPNTGEILALVGGRNFDNSKFNRATQAYRQPGSSFKPFVYAAAIEQGYRGVDHILDAPLHFANGWSPGNYTSNKFDGEVTLVTALARSINTPA